MKFKFIGDTPKRMYGDKILSKGDVVEYEGHIAGKAKNDPLLEVVADKPKRAAKAKPKAVEPDLAPMPAIDSTEQN